jgi:hypothetical protein
MKEYATIAVGVIVFMTVVITLTYLGMDFAINRQHENAYKNAVRAMVPIIVQCPDNTK